MPDMTTTTEKKVQANCRKAGLGVMGHILTVLYDRESVGIDTLLALSKSEENVVDAYEAFIAPAIDQLEAFLLNDYVIESED